MRGQAGLFDVDERLKRLSDLGDQLLAFTAAVDFDMFRPELTRALAYSDGSQGGRPPFDPVMMFKILVIQAANGLSDERAEFLINDRLSFMRFLGLGLSDRVPDARRGIAPARAPQHSTLLSRRARRSKPSTWCFMATSAARSASTFSTETSTHGTPQSSHPSKEAATRQAVHLVLHQKGRIHTIEGPNGEVIDRETFEREHLKKAQRPQAALLTSREGEGEGERAASRKRPSMGRPSSPRRTRPIAGSARSAPPYLSLSRTPPSGVNSTPAASRASRIAMPVR